jgi:hypothetical protein
VAPITDHADVEGFQALINKTEGRIGEIWYPDFPADTDNWNAVLRLIEEIRGTPRWSRRHRHQPLATVPSRLSLELAIFDLVLRTASGEKTKSEQLGIGGDECEP